MKDRIVNNVFLTGVAHAFTGLTRIVYNIVIGKSFDADTLGQVNLVISIAMLLSMVASLVSENSAIQFLSEYSSKRDQEGIYTLLLKWMG